MKPDLRPMLATLTDKPFDDPEWIFETKWDGFRAIAVAAPGRAAHTVVYLFEMSLPLREYSAARPGAATAMARNPSHLVSKIHSGSSAHGNVPAAPMGG